MTDTYDLEIEVKPEFYQSSINVTLADIAQGTDHLLGLVERARAQVEHKAQAEGATLVREVRGQDPNLRIRISYSRHGLVMPPILNEIGTINDRLAFIEKAQSHFSGWMPLKMTLKVGRVNTGEEVPR